MFVSWQYSLLEITLWQILPHYFEVDRYSLQKLTFCNHRNLHYVKSFTCLSPSYLWDWSMGSLNQKTFTYCILQTIWLFGNFFHVFYRLFQKLTLDAFLWAIFCVIFSYSTTIHMLLLSFKLTIYLTSQPSNVLGSSSNLPFLHWPTL